MKEPDGFVGGLGLGEVEKIEQLNDNQERVLSGMVWGSVQTGAPVTEKRSSSTTYIFGGIEGIHLETDFEPTFKDIVETAKSIGLSFRRGVIGLFGVADRATAFLNIPRIYSTDEAESTITRIREEEISSDSKNIN